MASLFRKDVMKNHQFTPSEQKTVNWFLSVAEALLIIETILLLTNLIMATFVVFLALVLWSIAGLGWGLYVQRRKKIQ